MEPDHHRLPTKRTVYGGMDGTGVPIQSRETAGRKGKQKDGSSKTREAKCGDIGKELSDFAKRVEREAKRRGVSQAARVVILGDGAAWIWKTADWLFPGSIHIVDRFHAKQHLSDLSKALFGSTPKAEEWTRYRYEELDGGHMDDLIKEIGIYSSRFPEAQQCCTYFQNNRERMRYPEFRSMGLCTSSRVVEAGCKSVVGGRLKKSGMHWSVAGANAILALRCSIKSGRYESFWERKASKLAA